MVAAVVAMAEKAEAGRRLLMMRQLHRSSYYDIVGCHSHGHGSMFHVPCNCCLPSSSKKRTSCFATTGVCPPFFRFYPDRIQDSSRTQHTISRSPARCPPNLKSWDVRSIRSVRPLCATAHSRRIQRSGHRRRHRLPLVHYLISLLTAL